MGVLYKIDPATKMLGIAPGQVTVDLRQVYSEIMDWLDSDEGMAYDPPMEAVGGFQLGTTGVYSDIVYVLKNGWQFEYLGSLGSSPWPYGLDAKALPITSALFLPDYSNVALLSDPATSEFEVESGYTIDGEALMLAADPGTIGKARITAPQPIDPSTLTSFGAWLFVPYWEDGAYHLEEIRITCWNVPDQDGFEFVIPDHAIMTGWQLYVSRLQDATIIGNGSITSPVVAVDLALEASPDATKRTFVRLDAPMVDVSSRPVIVVGFAGTEVVRDQIIPYAKSLGIEGFVATSILRGSGPQAGWLGADGLRTAALNGFEPVVLVDVDLTTTSMNDVLDHLMDSRTWIERTVLRGSEEWLAYRMFVIDEGWSGPGAHHVVGSVTAYAAMLHAFEFGLWAGPGEQPIPFAEPLKLRGFRLVKSTESVLTFLLNKIQSTGGALCVYMPHVGDGDPDQLTVDEAKAWLDTLVASGIDILSPTDTATKLAAVPLDIVGTLITDGSYEPVRHNPRTPVNAKLTVSSSAVIIDTANAQIDEVIKEHRNKRVLQKVSDNEYLDILYDESGNVIRTLRVTRTTDGTVETREVA